MAKRLLTCAIQNSNAVSIRPILHGLGGAVQCRKLHTSQIPVKEIQIPVAWGHIAGKLWGSGGERPILALHGWQDNAGTWDTLVPLLSRNRSILAIDLPGHGLSSWLPPGMNYYAWEFPRHILHVKDHFKWDKVSLLCHSMGSIAGFRFSSLFPELVDFYIGVENLIYENNFNINKYPINIQKGLLAQAWLDKEPPTYSLEEMKKIYHLGTYKSVSIENAKYLLERGAKPSKSDPNKYYFSRDPRLKYTIANPENKTFIEALVNRHKCPTLYIKAQDSKFASDPLSVEMRELLQKSNKQFESHFLPGTHHIHLNNPEIIAPLIINFLQKHKIVT